MEVPGMAAGTVGDGGSRDGRGWILGLGFLVLEEMENGDREEGSSVW
jgi:hypothetical protein